MAETKKTTTKTAEAKKTTTAKAPAKKTTSTTKTTTAKAPAKKTAPKTVETVAPVVEEKVEVATVEVKAPVQATKKEISGPKLQIKLVKSRFNRLDAQKKTLEALGLRKINQIVTKPDNAATRGMIYVVKHMVEVTEIK